MGDSLSAHNWNVLFLTCVHIILLTKSNISLEIPGNSRKITLNLPFSREIGFPVPGETQRMTTFFKRRIVVFHTDAGQPFCLRPTAKLSAEGLERPF